MIYSMDSDNMKMKIKFIAKYIIFLVLTLFICLYEFPYYIDAPGGLDNLNNKVKVEGAYEAEGSINLTYVSELKATLPLLLIAYFHPDWEIESKTSTNIGTLDYENYMLREQILMRQSYTSAIKYAYETAKKSVSVEEEKCYVTYLFEGSKTELKVSDQIISVDGIKINHCNEISSIVKTKKEGDISKLVVVKNDKQSVKTVEYKDFNGQTAIGIQLGVEYVLKTTPEYKMDFNQNEYGPSGGLMIALAVYNSLVETDITGGKIIAGTGTLEADGTVGEIGGIDYKLKGAVKKHADIFFAPSGENYEDAMKLKEERNYKIDIVEVKTFTDALEYLENNVIKK